MEILELSGGGFSLTPRKEKPHPKVRRFHAPLKGLTRE
jgi:hypothetical protein